MSPTAPATVIARFTALIAEDEPLLAQALQAELARAWPTLTVVATVGDGALAVAQALALVSTPTGNQAAAAAAPLTVIRASVGNTIRMVPINEVMYFEAADKYVRVVTAEHEYLIRTPLKELLPQLDAQVFWQVHRGTVVRGGSIESVTRDEAGKLHLTLQQRPERLAVSRLYADRFKAM